MKVYIEHDYNVIFNIVYMFRLIEDDMIYYNM